METQEDRDTLLKYFDFMMILERILAFKPPVRQRTIIWVFGYLGIWLFRVKTKANKRINE